MKKSHIARSKWLRAFCFVFIFLFIFCYLLIAISYQPLAFASESSPSADPLRQSDSEASIKEKLKALQEEIASRAADIKNEVSKKLLNKAYIGIIKSKDNASLTISLKSSTGNINISEFTEYIIKSKSYEGDSGLKNLAVSDSIAALGDIDDNGVLTAKRIVKLAKPVVFKRVLHGSITSIATSSAVLKAVQGDQFMINFDKNTDYQMGKTNNNFNFKDLKANQWIVAVSELIIPAAPDTKSKVTPTPTPENQPQQFLAKFVYIFPVGIISKPKTSTPSATPKP